MLSKLVGSISQALDFNTATLSGCIDIIAVPQDDGSLKSTPFHVRFGKVRVLRSRNKLVDVIVNGEDTGICMTLGSAGEAYFTKSSSCDGERSKAENETDDAVDVVGSGTMTIETDVDGNCDEEGVQFGLPFKVELSLCGHLLQGGIHDTETDRDIFEANKLTYDVASMTPQLWYHSTAVVRFNGQEPHYPAKAAIPMILSALVFKKLPPQSSIFDLMASVLTCYPGIINSSPTEEYLNAELGVGTTYGKPTDDMGEEHFTTPTCKFSICTNESPKAGDVDKDVTSSGYTDSINDNGEPLIIEKPEPIENRTLRPTSDQLAKMHLKWGHNEIIFRLQGAPKTIVVGNVFLWHPQSKIVVSDVDGTITKSDVLGQIAPLLGKDWSHEGVSEFMHTIQSHGYEMLYLTARAIGQADTTRAYLFDSDNNNTGTKSLGLPRGPLILSPDRLFSSFKREVIDRTPYIFKIAALRDIRSLFHHKSNPFYAGFGNRDTDHKAYTHVGIPEGKVYIINPNGVVQHVNSAYATSYESMNEISTYMFPPMVGGTMSRGYYDGTSQKAPPIPEDDFNDVAYFETAFPSIYLSDYDLDSLIDKKSLPLTRTEHRTEPSTTGDPDVGEFNLSVDMIQTEDQVRTRIGKRERLKKWIMAYGNNEVIPLNYDAALDVIPFQDLAQMFENNDEKEELERCMSLWLSTLDNSKYSDDLDNAEALWDGRSQVDGIEEMIWARFDACKNVLQVDDVDEITAAILNLESPDTTENVDKKCIDPDPDRAKYEEPTKCVVIQPVCSPVFGSLQPSVDVNTKLEQNHVCTKNMNHNIDDLPPHGTNDNASEPKKEPEITHNFG